MANSLRDKRILIFLQRNWGMGIGHFLASRLQAQGCRLAALTIKKSMQEFALKQQDVKYDLVLNDDEILNNPFAAAAAQKKYTLEEICQGLGVDSVWPLMQSMRILVRSYEDKYYYGFKQNVTDEWMVAYMQAVYGYVEKFFTQFKPDLILAPNFAALPHLFFNLYASRRGVPMLVVTDTKVKDYFAFVYSYNHDQGPFLDRVDVLNRGNIQSENLKRAQEYIAQFRAEFKIPSYVKPEVKKGLKNKLRQALSPYYYIYRFLIEQPKNNLPNLGVYPDFRPPATILRDYYSGQRYKKFMEQFPYSSLEKIGKFVYFPLQFQPEEVIDSVSPFFNNQIETARQVAMSLPDDYTLAVKEHPAMVGLRPSSYIEKIARTPNIKLIDYRLPQKTILEKCSLVITPGGTVLSEAAMFRRPAIQLGKFGLTLKLPNVFSHAEPLSLAKKIKEVLAVNLLSEDYESRLRNYVAAAYDKGFDFNYYKAWERGDLTGIETLWNLYHEEILRVLP